ncbi:MAG: hypothetical protein R2697_15810 [Ilumatobacteraceae bacterium]
MTVDRSEEHADPEGRRRTRRGTHPSRRRPGPGRRRPHVRRRPRPPASTCLVLRRRACPDDIGEPQVDPFGLERRLRKPLVVAVQGITYTAGIEIALAGDIVTASDVRYAQLEAQAWPRADRWSDGALRLPAGRLNLARCAPPPRRRVRRRREHRIGLVKVVDRHPADRALDIAVRSPVLAAGPPP